MYHTLLSSILSYFRSPESAFYAFAESTNINEPNLGIADCYGLNLQQIARDLMGNKQGIQYLKLSRDSFKLKLLSSEMFYFLS